MDHAGLPQRTVLSRSSCWAPVVPVPPAAETRKRQRPRRHPRPGSPPPRRAQHFDDAYRFETGDHWTGLRAEDAGSTAR